MQTFYFIMQEFKLLVFYNMYGDEQWLSCVWWTVTRVHRFTGSKYGICFHQLTFVVKKERSWLVQRKLWSKSNMAKLLKLVPRVLVQCSHKTVIKFNESICRYTKINQEIFFRQAMSTFVWIAKISDAPFIKCGL